MYLFFLIVLAEEESLAAKSMGVAKPLKVTPVVQFAPLLLQKDFFLL